MKQFYIIAAFVVTTLSFGQEQLLNGNFESWDDTNTPTSFTHIENVAQESTEVHSGSFSLKHTGGTSDLGQTITGIIPGEEYTLTLWYKVEAETGDGNDARIWSYWKNGSTNVNDNGNELRGPNNSYFDNNSNVWTEYTVTLTAPAGVDGFYFEVRTYSGAIVYWDDFSFFKTEATTEPTVQITSPNDNDSFPSGTTSVDITFTTSNIDLGLAGNQVNITVNSTLFEDISSPFSLNTVDGETYDISVDLLESNSTVDSESISFAVENPIAECPEAGSVIITEIMQNPAIVGDASGEYFELYNTTEEAIDINGWTISDEGSDSFTISSSVVIFPDSHIVLAINGDSETNGDIPDVAYVYSGFNLANGDDEIIVTCIGGTIIDQVAYDGGPSFPDPSGYSMELALSAYNNTDNDLGANWGEAITVFGDGDYGSPGKLSDFTLSTEAFNETVFNIYPNPTSNGFVNITSAFNQSINVIAFDILGKQVLTNTVKNHRLNVSTLQNGIYILKITQNGQSITKKLVIK